MPTELPTLSDGVVTLRVPEVTDAPDLVAEQDEPVVTWLTGHVFSHDEAIEWIAGVRECWANRRHRRNFAVVESASGRLVGGIEAHTDWHLVEGIEEGEANIGYWLGPTGRGRGFAVRSVRLLCRYLGDHAVERALIRTRPDNVPANRVAQRAGFTRVNLADDELHRWAVDLPFPIASTR